MLIEFPEFTPDLPDINNPGMILAKNVIPAGTSYKSAPNLETYSTSALEGTVKGAFSARDPETDTAFNFAGTSSKLYLLGATSGGVWDDVSKSGGYSVTTDEQWQFAQFGDEVIAVAITVDTQKYEMGVDTLFSDLKTDGTSAQNAPKARTVAVVKDDFLVVGNTNDGVDGYKPYRVRWAGIGTSDSWEVSAVTQADYQDLNASNGWIQTILGGQYGVIFQERAIVRMDYVGSPVIFQFTTVETNQGTEFPKSAIRVGDLCFFIGLDGFRVFDGNQSVQIGSNKVDNFFFDDLNKDYDYLITSAVDHQRQVVMWAYPSSELGLGAVNSRILFYNYSQNSKRRWSYADLTTEAIFTAITEGYTLDELDQWQIDHKDPASGTASAVNLDLLKFSLDSRVWVGQTIEFAAFNSSHQLAFASDSDFLTAVLVTPEVQITEGQRTDLMMFKPMIQGNSAVVTAEIGTRNLQSESVTWGSSIALDSNGHINSRSNARYHRLRISVSGGFTHGVGVELLEYQAAGYR